MKSTYKIVFLVMALATTGMLTNCSDDSGGGSPSVSYVRITDPNASDSLLVAAGQGQMIAIIGDNLKNTVDLWFNDQRATLNATFITDKSIITRIPNQIPETISNEMRLYFSNGDSLIYDFTVDISEPLVNRMKSEYVETGGEATFYGDFFYEPIQVTFAGGVEAEIVSVEDQILVVEVPDGAQSGPVTISSNFGATETDFWFRDNRNIITSFDIPLVNGVWQGPSRIVASDPAIPNINGKFLRVNQSLGAWPFFEMYGGPFDGDLGKELVSIPEAALLNPAGYNLKFEMNTLASLTGGVLRIHIGNAANGELDAQRQNASLYYAWQINLNTGGDWETVTIPWADVYKGFNPSSVGYSMFMYFHGPNAVVANFGMDNMRVVPITNEE